jgi:WS/DGAT/MGAT family acyltransferase
MDPVDVLIHKQERDPRRRTAVTLVLDLATVPGWERLVERFRRALAAAPVLRQKLVEPLPGSGPPEWVLDPTFDLGRHLTRIQVDDAAGAAEQLERFADADLPRDEPLWRACLVVRDDPAGASLLVRVSHVLTDGLGGLELLASLLDADRDGETASGTDAEPHAATGPPPAELSAIGLTAQRWLARPVHGPARALRVALDVARSGGQVVAQPRAEFTRAVRYSQSLARMLAAGGAPRSPLLRSRGGPKRYADLTVDARELRRAGRASGGTLHDAFLAAVVGGLRRYHEENGAAVDQVPFAIPVSTRHRDRGRGGNRFAPVRFAAPIGIVDPRERIAALAAIVARARAEPALDAMTVFAPALAHLPTPVLAIAGRAQDGLDAQASYVPGPPVPVQLAGQPIVAMRAYGPLPGPAVMAIMLTYRGAATVGFTVDTAAVTDIDAFLAAMRAGFAEVLAIGE